MEFWKIQEFRFQDSYIDFSVTDKSYLIDSFVVPDDGGIIKILYDSEKDNFLEVEFNNKC